MSADEEFPCAPFISPESFGLANRSAVQIMFCVIATPLCLATTLANVLVILSIFRTPSLHSPSNLLLISLAFSDLGVGLVSFPFYIVARVAKLLQDAPLFCITVKAGVVAVWLGVVSLLTLSAISVDRYVAVRYHLRYQQLVTKNRVRVIQVAIWVMSSLFALAFGIRRLDILNAALNVLFYGSLAIIFPANFFIYCVVRRHQRQIAVQRVQVQPPGNERTSLNLQRFKKSFTNSQILVGSLFVCYLPLAVIAIVVTTTGRSLINQNVLEFALLLADTNSTLNPFLYCWRYRPVRVALVKLLRDMHRKNSTWVSETHNADTQWHQGLVRFSRARNRKSGHPVFSRKTGKNNARILSNQNFEKFGMQGYLYRWMKYYFLVFWEIVLFTAYFQVFLFIMSVFPRNFIRRPFFVSFFIQFNSRWQGKIYENRQRAYSLPEWRLSLQARTWNDSNIGCGELSIYTYPLQSTQPAIKFYVLVRIH